MKQPQFVITPRPTCRRRRAEFLAWIERNAGNAQAKK